MRFPEPANLEKLVEVPKPSKKTVRSIEHRSGYPRGLLEAVKDEADIKF